MFLIIVYNKTKNKKKIAKISKFVKSIGKNYGKPQKNSISLLSTNSV